MTANIHSYVCSHVLKVQPEGNEKSVVLDQYFSPLAINYV